MTDTTENGVGAEVFTEDGRRAIYAGEIGGQKFVRILLSHDDEEYGTEEWPSDKLTPVSRVLKSAPVERYAPAIEAARADMEALRSQIATARENVRDLQNQERDLNAAIAKFPALKTAIDFLEGRITHVVVRPSYGAAKVETFSDYISMKNDYGRTEGIKLLCLFGTSERREVRWSVNRYYDGSGSWTEIFPFSSEAEAQAFIRDDFAAEIALWRSGEGRHNAYARAEGIPIEEWPEDWCQHIAAKRDAQSAEQIERLRAQIAEIEARKEAECKRLTARSLSPDRGNGE